MNRRTFVKGVVGSGLAGWAGLGGAAACGSGVVRGDGALAETDSKPIPNLTDAGRRILEYASLAPSGHNSQPWRVRILAPKEWAVSLDPARRLPVVDPADREALLSLGAFLENMVRTGGTMGWAAQVAITGRSALDPDLIRVTWSDAPAMAYPLERITMRRTVKHGFRPGEIRSADVDALARHAPGHLFYFPKGTPHADCLQKGAVEYFRVQTVRKDAQAELVRWLRLSRRDALAARDGLTTAGMEIEGMAGFWVRNFVRPEDFNRPSYRERSVALTTRLAGEGGGWLVITSPGSGPADVIEAGRRFQRMALESRERNLALHPMTQWMEEQSGRDRIGMNHPESMIPQFVLRVGYVDPYPSPVTLRRPVDWFTEGTRDPNKG
jgi:hypothetical protein